MCHGSVNVAAPVGCDDVTCENGASCTHNEHGLFHCKCAEGYWGTYCRSETGKVVAFGIQVSECPNRILIVHKANFLKFV